MTLGMAQPQAMLAALVVLGTTVTALAAEDARVLPAGRSRFSLAYGQSGGVTHTFNNSGRSETLTAPYQLDLSAQNLGAFDRRINELIHQLNNTGYRYDASQRNSGTHGITTDTSKPQVGDALGRGKVSPDAQGERKQYAITLQHGITDRLSVGFMTQYVHTRVDVGHTFSGANTAEDIRRGLGARNGLSTDMDAFLRLISSADAETLQQVLLERGYSRFEDRITAGLGDTVLGGRYNYLNSKRFIHSLQLGLTVPTGRISTPSELTEVDNGQGAWDYSLAHLMNFNVSSKLMLSQGLHYTHRLPSSRYKRIDPSSLLPTPDTEERVSMMLGDKAWFTTGAKWSFSDAFSIDFGYEWYWKMKDRFQGSRPVDYSYLSEAMETRLRYMETLQVGLSVSSIPSFLRKEFLLPGEFLINYYWPTRGRNAVIAPYGTAELALYF